MSEDWKWYQSNSPGVAMFINPDVKDELYIEENIFDLKNKNHQDLTPVIKLLYDKLKKQKIRYNNEKGMTDDNQAQSIRKPNEILDGNKEGTCLDLTLLFCGLCLGHGLLPIFVLLEKHALVAVSKKLTESNKRSIARPKKQLLERGAITNTDELNNLRKLVEEENYILIECTGFAHTETISNDFPEGEGRVDGFLDFESAVKAGYKQLDRRKLKMFIDVEIAHRLVGIKPLPFQQSRATSNNHFPVSTEKHESQLLARNMSVNYKLTGLEIDTLAEYVKKCRIATNVSQRKQLCTRIGIENLDNINDIINEELDSYFAFNLIDYLNNLKNTDSILQLCNLVTKNIGSNIPDDLKSITDKLNIQNPF